MAARGSRTRCSRRSSSSRRAVLRDRAADEAAAPDPLGCEAGRSSIVAPPGYGKTSLLVQWAIEDPRPVAWLTADDARQRPRGPPHGDRGGDRPPRAPRVWDVRVHRVTPSGPSGRPSVGCSTRWPGTPGACGSPSTMCTGSPRERASTPSRSSSPTCPRDRRWRSRVAPGAPAVRALANTGALLEIGPADLAMDEHEAIGLGRELGLTLSADRGGEPDPADGGLARPAGARGTRSGGISWRRRPIPTMGRRPPRRRLPPVRGAREPLDGRDRLPDPNLDPRAARPGRCATP